MSRRGPDGVILKRVIYRFHSEAFNFTTDILECGHISGGPTRKLEPKSRQCWDCHLGTATADPEKVAVQHLGPAAARKARIPESKPVVQVGEKTHSRKRGSGR